MVDQPVIFLRSVATVPHAGTPNSAAAEPLVVRRLRDMAIRYTPQPLKGKIWPFWVLGIVTALATFGLLFGAFFTARWIGTTGAVALAIVVFIGAIIIHHRIKRRIGSSLEAGACPRCGKRRMHFKEESSRDRQPRAYLICPDCGTKWDLGQI